MTILHAKTDPDLLTRLRQMRRKIRAILLVAQPKIVAVANLRPACMMTCDQGWEYTWASKTSCRLSLPPDDDQAPYAKRIFPTEVSCSATTQTSML